MADCHLLEGAEVAEGSAANAKAVGAGAAAGYQVNAVLAAGVLTAHVHLIGSRPQPRYAGGQDRAVGHLLHGLLDYSHRLADFLKANEVAVVAVAVRARWDVEVEAVVDAVGL